MRNYIHCDPQSNVKNCSMFRLMEQFNINHSSDQQFIQQLFQAFKYIQDDDGFCRKLLIENDQDYCDELMMKQRQTFVFFKYVRIPYLEHLNIDLHLRPLFAFLKKNYNLIRLSSIDNCIYSQHESIDNFLRNYCEPIIDCLNFLKLVSAYLLKHDETSLDCFENSKLLIILEEMKKTLLFVGRLKQFEMKFQEFSFHRKADLDSYFYHYFHITLQIWLTYAELLFLIKRAIDVRKLNFSSQILNELNLLSTDVTVNSVDQLFEQYIRLFLYDLLCFNVERFKDNLHGNDSIDDEEYNYSCYLQTANTSFTPFICTCFEELILLFRFMVNHGRNDDDDDRFQTILFEVLTYLDPKNSNDQSMVITPRNEIQIDQFKSIIVENYLVKDFDQYSLWIWSNFLPLLSINLLDRTKLIHQKKIPINIIRIYRTIFHEIDCRYPFNKHINLTGKCRLIPVLLVFSLRYMRFISMPSIDLLILFIDFYLKRFNHAFSIQSSVKNNQQLINGETMLITVKNSKQWLENITEIINYSNITHFDDSFNLFLYYFHQQLNRIDSQSSSLTMNQQLDKTTMMMYQKVLSKIIVTLQSNFLRQIKSNSFYRIGLLYSMLIAQLPDCIWLEYSDRLLNPIKELIKSKQTIDFKEILLKFLFTILQLKSSSSSTINNYEYNRRISSMINRFINDIIIDESVLINPSNDYYAIINLYFNELLLMCRSSRHQFEQLLYFIDDLLIGKFELLNMYRRLLSHESYHHQQYSDRLIVWEFFEKFIDLIQENNGNKSEPLINDNLIKNLMLSLIELIKMEIVHESNSTNTNNNYELIEIIAKISLEITLIRSAEEDMIDTFLSLSSLQQPQQNSHRSIDNLDTFQLNYLYFLLTNRMIMTNLTINHCNDDKLLEKLTAIWLKLLIVIDFDDNDCDNNDSEQKMAERLLKISEVLYFNFLSPSSEQQFTSESIFEIFKKFIANLRVNFCSSSSMVTNIDRLNQINRCDHYLRPMVLKSQQILLGIGRRYCSSMSKSTNNLFVNLSTQDLKFIERIYKVISELISNLSKQIYIVGKSDCLMIIIIEHVIIPPLNCQFILQIKPLWPTLYRHCFPLIYEGLLESNASNDPYLTRKIRQLILLYLPQMCQYLNYANIKTLLSNRSDALYAQWHQQIVALMKTTYLVRDKETTSSTTSPTMTKDLYEYLNQFCHSDSLTSNELFRLSEVIFRTNITELNINNLNSLDYRLKLYQTIMLCLIKNFKKANNIENRDEIKLFIEQILGPFIKTNAQLRPAKLFDIMKFLLPPKVNQQYPLLFHEFCSEINRQMDYFERISLGANQLILRNLLREFVSYYEKNRNQ